MRYLARFAVLLLLPGLCFAQPALVTTAADVAEVVWQAANDTSGRLQFAAGPDAVALARQG